jgi:hypothetical protein
MSWTPQSFVCIAKLARQFKPAAHAKARNAAAGSLHAELCRKIRGQSLLVLPSGDHPTVRSDPSTVEPGCDPFAGNGWKGERKERIVGHGGSGSARSSESDGFSTQFLRSTNPLRHIR